MNKSLYSYAIFALPLSFIGVPLYIYLPEYYSSNFGIPLAAIGLIVLLTRFFDTITDPVCGYISDKLSRFSKEIIFLSAIMTGLCFYALFNPLCNNKSLNLVVFSILTYFFFSLLVINHLALIGTFQNKILASSVREGFTVIGLLIATVVPSLLMLRYSSLQTFKIIGISLFFLMLLCLMLFYINVNVKYSKTNTSFKFKDVNNALFWKYFAALFFNGMAVAVPSTLVIFYVKHFLHLEKYVGVFLMMYFASAIIFIPLWKFMCNKIGAISSLKVGMMCSVGVFCTCYFLNNGDIFPYLMICLLSGAFFGIDLMAPNIITNRIIEMQNIEHSRGLIFGITHFISKVSIAVVSGAMLIALGGVTGVNYENVLHFSYTILPCIFKMVALYMLHLCKENI